jgi:hypothetical protein
VYGKGNYTGYRLKFDDGVFLVDQKGFFINTHPKTITFHFEAIIGQAEKAFEMQGISLNVVVAFGIF